MLAPIIIFTRHPYRRYSSEKRCAVKCVLRAGSRGLSVAALSVWITVIVGDFQIFRRAFANGIQEADGSIPFSPTKFFSPFRIGKFVRRSSEAPDHGCREERRRTGD